MKRVGLILLVSLLAVVPALGAVYNVNLTSQNNSGISGTATTITSSYGGATPLTKVEVNAMMNQAPPSNMVYEAWLVDNQTNTRQSLGVFSGRQLSTNVSLTSFAPGNPWDAIAISEEPVNSTSVNPGQIVAMGSLPGSPVSAANFATMAVLPPDENLQMALTQQQFGMSASDYTNLRMQGLSPAQINTVANIAKQCNQTPMQAANTYMMNGGDLNAVASACGISVATILTPAPSVVAVVPTTPAVPGTVAAGPMPSVPTYSYYLLYPNGTPVLTESQWLSYARRGYNWRDVAIAANISAQTGTSIDQLLREVRIQGMTWQQVAIEQGVSYDQVTDVSGWPWGTTARNPLGSAPPPPSLSSPSGTGTSNY